MKLEMNTLEGRIQSFEQDEKIRLAKMIFDITKKGDVIIRKNKTRTFLEFLSFQKLQKSDRSISNIHIQNDRVVEVDDDYVNDYLVRFFHHYGPNEMKKLSIVNNIQFSSNHLDNLKIKYPDYVHGFNDVFYLDVGKLTVSEDGFHLSPWYKD